MLSDGLLITTSVDQRLHMWRLATRVSRTHNQEEMFLSRVKSCVHDVADAAGMLTFQTK